MFKYFINRYKQKKKENHLQRQRIKYIDFAHHSLYNPASYIVYGGYSMYDKKMCITYNISYKLEHNMNQLLLLTTERFLDGWTYDV